MVNNADSKPGDHGIESQCGPKVECLCECLNQNSKLKLKTTQPKNVLCVRRISGHFEISFFFSSILTCIENLVSFGGTSSGTNVGIKGWQNHNNKQYNLNSIFHRGNRPALSYSRSYRRGSVPDNTKQINRTNRFHFFVPFSHRRKCKLHSTTKSVPLPFCLAALGSCLGPIAHFNHRPLQAALLTTCQVL